MTILRLLRKLVVARGAVVAIFTFGVGAAVPTASRAQFAIDKTEMFLHPSDSTNRMGILTVRNEGSERAQASIRIEDWDRAEDGGNRFFAAGTKSQSCAAALKVFPLSVSLAPGESQAVRVELDAKASESLRDHECWSVVLVETAVPEVSTNGRTLLYRLRTGLKVYSIPSGLSVNGEVADVAVRSASPSSALARDTIEVAFQNTGAKHVIARGHVEIRRADNSTVATVELPLAYALPGATMRVRGMLPSLPAGRYIVLAVLDYGGSELAAAQLEHEVRE